MYCPNCKQEFDGKFCPECETKIVEIAQLYLKTAEQGDIESLYCLGRMLKEVCEFEDAYGCFQQAAEQGHAASQYELAVAYSIGIGVEQNDEESLKWYHKAAEQGHEEAIGFLEELEERVPAKQGH